MMDSLPPLEPTIEQLPTLDVDSLTYEKRRLENSIYHLNRSNEELKNYDENDNDFKLAIKENEELIIKLRDKINLIENILTERRQKGNNCIEVEISQTTESNIPNSTNFGVHENQMTLDVSNMPNDNSENDMNEQSTSDEQMNNGFYL
ncbi:1104_t:CDS:2 [Diversispora eburnea]|uniref:1104_t:CDS:1 n=1 Tax=Diversispora eburnea TaxID=1213867 RepID=A0A9N9CAT2_9GLOM|nr:1104_t:CDS:2 [Diversispora eburnea]